MSGDSYGNFSAETDASLPLTERLSLGFGAQLTLNEFYNGTDSLSHNEALSLRWRPTEAIEIIPFWQRSEVVGDEAGPIYIPAGAYLPPRIKRRRYNGPEWADYDSIAANQGVLASVAPATDWLIRAGLFRSLYDDRSTFAQLLTDVTPAGEADRLIIADARQFGIDPEPHAGRPRPSVPFSAGQQRCHLPDAGGKRRGRRGFRSPRGGRLRHHPGPRRVGVRHT